MIKKILLSLTLLTVAIALLVANFWLGVLVFVKLTSWFLGIQIAFAQAFGIMLLVSYLRTDLSWEDLQKKLRERLYEESESGFRVTENGLEKLTESETKMKKALEALGMSLKSLMYKGIVLGVGWVILQYL